MLFTFAACPSASLVAASQATDESEAGEAYPPHAGYGQNRPMKSQARRGLHYYRVGAQAYRGLDQGRRNFGKGRGGGGVPHAKAEGAKPGAGA